jgi:hypothetical protein
MLKLRLNCDDCLDNYAFNFTPNLFSIFAESAFFSNWLKGAFQNVLKSQLVSVSVEIVIFLVQTIISQMDIGIISLVSTQVVRLTSQSDKTIFVQKDCHRINYTCYENINSKVILMSVDKCWFFDVFLNNIAVLFYHNLRRLLHSIWVIRLHWVWIYFGSVIVILSFEIFIKLLCLSLKLAIQLLPHVLDFPGYENTPTLTACIWFANQENRWISETFLFSEFSVINIIFSLVLLLLKILLNVMIVRWVKPSFGKEIEVLRK